MSSLPPVSDPYFNPYEAPKAATKAVAGTPAHGLWREGDQLVMAKTADLPDRCFRCDEPAGGYRLSRKLSWHPGGYYLLLLVSVPIYVIVALIVRNTARVGVPLCAEHRKRRLRSITTGWLLTLGGIGELAWLIVTGGPGKEWTDSLVIVGVVLFLAGLIWGVVGSQVTAPSKIDKHFVRLKKASPDLLAGLPDWPGWAS